MKDLEKDEREWTIYLDELESMSASYEQITIVPKARLQQVEADVEDLVSTLQRLLSVCEGGEYRPERVEEAARGLLDKHKVLNLPQATLYGGRLAQSEAELSIAREALAFYADPDTYLAIAMLADPPCGEFMWDFEELPHDGYKPGKRARDVLARLQAKGART